MPSIIYSYYMSGLIQSLPSPSAYSGGITHTWLGESWMVNVEVLVMMMAMISSVSPSRQGARTEFVVPSFSWWRRNGLVLRKAPNPLVLSCHVGHIGERGGREGAGGGQTPPWRGQAWPASGWCLAHPGPFCSPPSGSVGLLGKIGLLAYFLGFFPKVDFLHKNKTPGQFC